MVVYPLDGVEALLVVHSAEHDVPVVQPVRHHRRDEELGAVRVLNRSSYLWLV